jgi:hypothetical protein
MRANLQNWDAIAGGSKRQLAKRFRQEVQKELQTQPAVCNRGSFPSSRARKKAVRLKAFSFFS